MVFAIHPHELATGIYVSPISWTPLLPPYPSQLSQSISFGCPASCPELALVIYFTYGNVRFNAILSNHPTLAFSHCVQKPVLHMCLLCCTAWRIIGTVFLNSIYIQYLSFSFWLTSLCIIGSSFIYLIRTELNMFLFIAE